MLIPGLVSVTFRPLSRADIVSLMLSAGLTAIEWGGDVHVPPTDEDAMTDALHLTEGKLLTVSYGSYYRCKGDAMLENAETAISMEVPNIRVWAGQRGSADADAPYRAEVVRHIRELCDRVSPHGMTVSTEFHGGTLTDHYESTVRLIHEVERENFCTYWQPNQFRDDAYNLAALNAILPWLTNVHVFTWAGHAKYPLAHGGAIWQRYIDILRTHGGNHGMLMEFVCDDTVEQFRKDAETLLKWLKD